jgi:NADH-quinone oxidoreductase subunit G
LDAAVAGSLAGGVILVGERMASSAGALTAAMRLAERSGARLAWVPRRAGERGAVDAGALPTLLPGGRPVDDDAARVEVERVWAGSIPSTPGRDLPGILAAAADGELAALIVGGVELADLPDRVLAEQAFADVGFLVSLEQRESPITRHADVVLPVASVAEKAGRFVTWEGRRRPFDLTLRSTGQLSDARVLNALADEMDIALGLPSHEAARAELAALSTGTARTTAPSVAASPPNAGDVLLATWRELIDDSRALDGEENLTGTAKPLRAVLSPATADRLGLLDASSIRISTRSGSLIAPLVLDAVLDGVVWMPSNHPDGSVLSELSAGHGDAVTLSVALHEGVS